MPALTHQAHRGDRGDGRRWMSLRHRLHKALVESGEKHMERVQSLPKMSELVTTTRNNAMDTRPSTRIGGEPIEGLRRDGVPPARRLYEGIGSVKRLSSSALRGKRIISGPFGEEVSSHALATGAADSANTSDLAPQTDRGSGNGVENRQLSDGEAEKRKDAADYLDFLSSEFMARLHSAGDAHERRRRSQWKRDFEYALDKRKRKQARSDEFFEIYRRTHGIESAAANFNDYFLLEAAYDVDFDDELHRMFPTSLRGRYSAEEGPSSVPTTRPHLVGGEGSPLDLGRLKHDFAGIEDNTLVHGDSSHPLPSAPSVVPESETGTHSSASTDEGGAAEGDDRGLDGNDGKSMRALVDDDDIDRELDDVTKAASASIGGNKSLDDIEMAGRSIGTARTVAGRGRVLGNSDRVTKGSSMGPKGDLRRAGNDGESCSNKRQQEGYRSRRSKLARKSFACPGDDDIDDVAGDLRKHASERGELDRSDCSSTELTLGRPDPTSVHWKFSRRLLQTRTTPMALTETVEGGVELSLPHQSLGDTYIELISEVVKDLPGVTRLDLRDNRLTDVGVQEIVQAICSMDGHRGIQVLDLSENKLDTVSAKSLCTFLKSPTCCLREILLAKADIDDAETAIVMEAMQFNHSVRYLDFSDNAIGGGYEKTQRLAGGPTTGGASISLALGVNTTLRRIDLQWNLLGSKSGVLLGSALAHNHTLEWLDVSYNAIGEEGAQAIGTGLAVNDGLVRLDLSYNEISSRGVLVIAQALEDNDRLEVLRLDGNNIGFDGGRTLIRSLNYWSLSRTLGLKHCMLESRARTGDCFDPLYPTGKYTLDCSRPYQKAVAYELLRSASTRPGSSVRSLVVRDNLSDKKGVDVKVVRPGGGVDLWTMLGRQQQDQHQQGQSRPGSEHSGKCGSRHGPTCPFATMDAVEWQFKLKEAWVIDASTGNRFYPPDKGFLEVDFLCHPLPPTGWALINASGMQHLQALAEGDEQCRDQPLLYLKMAAKDLFFSSAQVNEILRNNAKKLDSLQVHELMTALISRLYNPGCLHGLLEMHLEPRQIHIIQKNFGHAFAAFTTCVGGHYSLDLSRELDREAAIRLSEWSHLDQMCLRVLSSWAGESGGTSQKGRWSSFRNERYRKRPFTRGITEGFFKLGLTDRVPGVLEFDFVSIARPSSDTPPLTPGQFDRFVTQCGLARLMAELPSPLAKSSTSAGGLGADDDGVVNAMMGISLGDAVRLKLASDTSEKLRASTANATHILQIEERRRALAASAESFGLSDDDCDWGDIPSPFASPRASVASVKSQAGRVFGKQRGGGGIGGAGAGQDASTRESTAAARRRSLASQLARQRLKKAARYAGAGLAVAPPFAARVSLGERSLEEALSRGGVDWKRWENGKLSALWRHLLAKDCALMEIAPPLLIAHIVRVRVCHGTEDKTLEKRSPADAPLAEEPGPWLSRGFLGRLVKTKGTRPGQDPKRVATSLVLDTFRDFLSNEADVWLVKRETLESKASSLCPDAPSIRKNTIEHIFDAYVDKLPDHDFGRSVPVSREATATTPIDVSAEPGVNPKAAHQESDAEDVCKGPSPPSFPRGKLSDSSRATSGFGRSRREMSRVADETSSGDDLGRGLNGAAVAEDDNNGNNADRDCGNSGGGDCESMRPAFAWVASHEGDAGPHTAVLAQKAEWAVVARDVRFRLANAWLSCDQAKILASIFPERAKGITTNPREDLVVELFGRVTDVDNFSVVLGTLDGEAQLSVGRRLGWLNVLNPHQIDRRYDLDLRHSDHRRVARVLSDMAVAEPGPNLQNQRFSRHADPARHFFIPGWEVPQTWPAAAARGIGGGYGGVPDDGHFAVEYCSDEAIGCKANPEIRERLRAEAFLCGVASDRGLGVFGYMDEDLAKTLAELPSL